MLGIGRHPGATARHRGTHLQAGLIRLVGQDQAPPMSDRSTQGGATNAGPAGTKAPFVGLQARAGLLTRRTDYLPSPSGADCGSRAPQWQALGQDASDLRTPY